MFGIVGRRRGLGRLGPPKAIAAILAACQRAPRASPPGAPRRPAAAPARRLGQHHPDGERRRLVVDEPEREQPLDEVAGRRVRPDLPRASRAAALAQDRRGSQRARPPPRRPAGGSAARRSSRARRRAPSRGRSGRSTMRSSAGPERRVGVGVLRELDQLVRRSLVAEILAPRIAVDLLQVLDARRRTPASRRTGSAGRSRATCRRFPGPRCRRRARAASLPYFSKRFSRYHAP